MNWPNIFVDQGQFMISDPDFIRGTHQRENIQFTHKLVYMTTLKCILISSVEI
jgi:hypothetical protein